MGEQKNGRESYEQLDALAIRILAWSRDTLLVKLRFLDIALDLLRPRSYSGTLATDGRTLFYDPYYIVFTFRKTPSAILKQHLHLYLHCLFRHLFVSPQLDRRKWDTACDLAVENVLAGMELPELTAAFSSEQRDTLKKLEKQIGVLSADRLYCWLEEEALTEREIAHLREPFQADDHRIWYLPPNPGTRNGREAGSSQSTQEERKRNRRDSRDTEGQWKTASGRIADRLSERIREPGINAAALLQNLIPLTREKQSYTDFLKRFAVYGEVVQISHEEFDSIFYTYGLKLYGNLPLIEPLEYSEVRKIRDFVIAVDTSGSVKGELVQAFIRRTCEILSQRENFFRQVCVHILQCDAEIQEDVCIRTEDDLKSWLSGMTLKGFGGTDFRPVFRRVEELRAKGELRDLKGLIYFTDGLGIYPENRPDYETAFVFIDERGLMPEVPPWAIRLILSPDEIGEE
ncbi:MAG: VWA-like domain-containing protein [Oscillospiraceae bacterium]|nr:VWA-like domain-containing protein [Oscillospiraceae bacterium]